MNLVDQPRTNRWGTPRRFTCLPTPEPEVAQNLLDRIGIFDAGNDSHCSSAVIALLDVDREHPASGAGPNSSPMPAMPPWLSCRRSDHCGVL